MEKLTLKEFYQENKENLNLNLICGEDFLKREIKEPYINFPGIAIAGYLERFHKNRIQLMGETDYKFMTSFSESEMQKRMQNVFQMSPPCFILSKGNTFPESVEYLATEEQIPVFSTTLNTDVFFTRASYYLENYFIGELNRKGNMVSVNDVGILITGAKGVGKSHCVLHLIEKGYRLIADEEVKIRKNGNVLLASAKSKNPYAINIYGIGEIDVKKLYGLKSITKEKKIEIHVILKKKKKII